MTIHIRSAFIQRIAVCGFILAAGLACTRAQPTNGSPPAHATARASKSGSKPAVFLDTMRSVPVETLNPTGPGIELTPSGVPTKIIKRGTGTRHPTSDDGVILYSQAYDSAGHVVARWDGFAGDPDQYLDRSGCEMLLMMVEGEVRRIWYPDVKSPGGMMVADYELTWITPRPEEETLPPRPREAHTRSHR